MSKKYKFELVTPIGPFYSDEVDFISFTAINGEIGILANHAPVLIANKPCTLTIEKDGQKKYAFMSEGFVQVSTEKVSAIVDMAMWSEDIKDEEAIRDLKIAEEELEKTKDDREKAIELMASIERIRAAIKASRAR